MRAQPSTPLEVKEQWVAAVTEAIKAVDIVVANYTQLFKKSLEVPTGLQEDPNIQRLEMKEHKVQQHYDEVKGTVRTITLT